MDAQGEVGGHFFEKLSLWREDSHREFSNVLQLHSNRIKKGIGDLAWK